MTQRFSPRIAVARESAFSVLQAVGAGGYASDELRLHSVALSGRDAGLAAQIVFGTLRFQGQLDFLIERYSGRQAARLDEETRLALRTAIYQLRYLQRIPAHAAVHETVEWIKRRKRAAAGLVNAVLRKVNREPVPWPDRAVALSCPPWLLRRWDEHFGQETGASIAAAFLREPVRYTRMAPGSEAPPGLVLEATDVQGCFEVLEGTPERLHDIGSQAVLSLLDLRPGLTYLDVCAAPGNKTRQALETPLSLAVACDLSVPRLRTVPPLCPRVVLDGTAPLPFGRKFDRIFIDAPCSGTGTVGRNPEIKWRVRETDFAGFALRQRQLLGQALMHLAPGGKLLYATCSLEREENEDVVARVLAEHPEVLLVRESWRVPGREPGDGFYGAVLCAGVR